MLFEWSDADGQCGLLFDDVRGYCCRWRGKEAKREGVVFCASQDSVVLSDETFELFLKAYRTWVEGKRTTLGFGK